jgi:hypothetical protein
MCQNPDVKSQDSKRVAFYKQKIQNGFLDFNMPDRGDKTMRFVIIGADAAGMSAASRAKRIKADLEVSVLEQTRDVSYSA